MMKVAVVLISIGASAWLTVATVYYAVHHRREGTRYYAKWVENDDGYPPYGV
jgi:hypothetical protein